MLYIAVIQRNSAFVADVYKEKVAKHLRWFEVVGYIIDTFDRLIRFHFFRFFALMLDACLLDQKNLGKS